MELFFYLGVGVLVAFYKITTQQERDRWWWQFIAVLAIGAAIGFVWTVVTTGSIPY